MSAVAGDAGWLRAAPEPVAVALRDISRLGLELPVRFWVPALLEDYAEVVREHAGTLPTAYADAQRSSRAGSARRCR